MFLLNTVDFLFDFVEYMPVGIARADAKFETPNHYNAYFLEMFGWKDEEIDTLEKWFQKAYPDDEYRADIVAIWNDIVEETKTRNEKYSRPMEAKVACKDGSYKWCEVRYYGKDKYIYGIFTDISERKNIEKQLRDLSLIDPLTEIHNRRYFNIKFYDRWHLSERSNTPISLIMCDIDNFKQVNDIYGHLVGDQVLTTIAKTISSTLKRSTDFVARFGGEEFVIVCYDCDEQSAVGLCRRIKHNLTQTDILGIDEANKCCTLSFGVATTIANTSMSPEQFINNADMAMYEAKKNGKNQIIAFQDNN